MTFFVWVAVGAILLGAAQAFSSVYDTTGGSRIRATVPAGWQVADKTGTGDYGSANDIAVIYPPDREPIVIAIYTRQPTKDAHARSDIIVRAARIVMDTLIH